MNLTKEISFLLYKHNCVIVPNFGAFILNEKSAEVNTLTNYTSPRNRIIIFNSQINNNDGLLANHIKRNLGISYEDALDKIFSYVSNIQNKLSDQKNLNLDQIGTFYLTNESKLIFVPNHLSNFNIESFGLPRVKLNSQIRALKTKDPVKVEQITKPQQRAYQAPKSKQDLVKVRNEKVQERKVKLTTPKKRSKYQLKSINLLGSLFLIAMVISLINFEMKLSNSDYNQNVASIIDSTPIETIKTFSLEIETPNKIFAEVKNRDEAINLKNKLSSKYKQVKAIQGEDGKFKVFIISFSDRKLAKEYQKLLQNRMNQKLSLE
tara:strand:+ start:3161 stop:4123 length:963 start_codon:yes stop_codon:yes gene_type:complete